jgi:hypothetical protein
MLYLYRRVVFGALTKPDVKAMKDLNLREVAIFLPLIALVMWMGIYPSSVIKPMAPSIARVLENYHARVDAWEVERAAAADAAMSAAVSNAGKDAMMKAQEAGKALGTQDKETIQDDTAAPAEADEDATEKGAE